MIVVSERGEPRRAAVALGGEPGGHVPLEITVFAAAGALLRAQRRNRADVAIAGYAHDQIRQL